MRNLVVSTAAAVGLAGAILLFAVRADAEKVDMPADKLAKTATHVVVGDVRAVYAREERVENWLVTHYLAEVAAKSVEKGEGVEAGQLVYVRYWTREWRGGDTMPPSTAGHRGLPKAGEKHRVYLARNAYDGFTEENNDGGYNVIGANGFERLGS